MKKILALILILAALLAVCSCANDTVTDDTTAADDTAASDETTVSSDGEDTTSPDGKPVIDWNFDLLSLNKKDLTDDQIEKIELDALENGYTVSWNDDGSIIVKFGGSTFDMSGQWPENEYTALIPKPDVPVTASAVTETGCDVLLKWSLDEAKAYTELVKAAGFITDGKTEEDALTYGYYAKDGKGHEILVTYGGVTQGVSITDENDHTTGVTSDVWPENNYTALIPKPDFGTSYEDCSAEMGIGFTVIVYGATEDNVKTYIRNVKNTGFTEKSKEDNSLGMLNYTAYNADNMFITITYYDRCMVVGMADKK